MRVGRYAVVVLDDGTMAVTRMYPGLCDDGSIRPGSQYWAVHVRDRTTQLDLVVAHLAGHPLAADVLADVAEERVHLAEGDRIHVEIERAAD